MKRFVLFCLFVLAIAMGEEKRKDATLAFGWWMNDVFFIGSNNPTCVKDGLSNLARSKIGRGIEA